MGGGETHGAAAAVSGVEDAGAPERRSQPPARVRPFAGGQRLESTAPVGRDRLRIALELGVEPFKEGHVQGADQVVVISHFSLQVGSTQGGLSPLRTIAYQIDNCGQRKRVGGLFGLGSSLTGLVVLTSWLGGGKNARAATQLITILFFKWYREEGVESEGETPRLASSKEKPGA